jgi:hypothetical protein
MSPHYQNRILQDMLSGSPEPVIKGAIKGAIEALEEVETCIQAEMDSYTNKDLLLLPHDPTAKDAPEGLKAIYADLLRVKDMQYELYLIYCKA